MKNMTAYSVSLLLTLCILMSLGVQLALGTGDKRLEGTAESNQSIRDMNTIYSGTAEINPIPQDKVGPVSTVGTGRGFESIISFEEDFDNLPPGDLPSGWDAWDADGNGITWSPTDLHPYEGKYAVTTGWVIGDCADWLVTPMVTVPPGGDSIQFFARSTSEEGTQSWDVWINTEGTEFLDFILYGDVVGEGSTASTTYEQFSYPIDATHYEDMCVAIRRTSGGVGGYIYLDAFEMSNSGVFQGFEVDPQFPPPDWSHEVVQPGTNDQPEWSLSDGTEDTYPPGVTPHNGQYMVKFNSYEALDGSARLATPPIDFTQFTHNTHYLTFWMFHDSGWPGNPDTLRIQISEYGGTYYPEVAIPRINGTEGWQQHTVDLSVYDYVSSVSIGFLGISHYGNNIYIDDIVLTSSNESSNCYYNNFVPETPGGYFGSYEAGMGTYMYFNPNSECFDRPAYPASVESIAFILFDFGGCVWPAELDIVIYDAAEPWDSCGGFGDELCRYPLSADPETYDLNVGVFEFPEPCCIYGPFYAGIEYREGEPTTSPSLLFEEAKFPENCEAWMRVGDQVYEWSDFWAGAVGYPWMEFAGKSRCPECDRHVLLHEGLQTPPPEDSNVIWRQIWPIDEYNTYWHQDGWTDDGDNQWSESDILEVSVYPDRDSLRTYCVEHITQMLEIYDYSTDTHMFIEYYPMSDTILYWYPLLPTAGYWRVVLPTHLNSDFMAAIDVTDYNGNDIIDAGDVMYIEDMGGTMHVAEVIDVWNSLSGKLCGSGSSYVCGDSDGSGAVDIDDVVYLISYIFGGGPAPEPLESGDGDCSGGVDIDDVVYLITYIFSAGPSPCDPDDNGVPNC
jgi:hypothetical protein